MPDFADGYQRGASSEMIAFLQQDVLTFCVCVRMALADGRVFGFTTHDENVVFNSEAYEALSSVSASAIRQELGNGIDNLDVIGMLQSERITESDLRAGLYDGANLWIYLVNWLDTSMGGILLLKGSVGNLTITDGQYAAEVRSLMQRFTQQVGEVTCPTCRVFQLGDARCAPGGFFADGKTLSDYQFLRRVTVITNAKEFTFNGPFGDTHPTGYYNYGRVLWMTGANAGKKSSIKTHTNVSDTAVIVLQEKVQFIPAITDAVKLEAGCDRTIAVCHNTFSNEANMRGEPYMPGSDKLLAVGRPPGS
jgi:uncharacterized phage protein (TIGR02218 family)